MKGDGCLGMLAAILQRCLQHWYDGRIDKQVDWFFRRAASRRESLMTREMMELEQLSSKVVVGTNAMAEITKFFRLGLGSTAHWVQIEATQLWCKRKASIQWDVKDFWRFEKFDWYTENTKTTRSNFGKIFGEKQTLPRWANGDIVGWRMFDVMAMSHWHKKLGAKLTKSDGETGSAHVAKTTSKVSDENEVEWQWVFGTNRLGADLTKSGRETGSAHTANTTSKVPDGNELTLFWPPITGSDHFDDLFTFRSTNFL